jgi:hypothetical protein
MGKGGGRGKGVSGGGLTDLHTSEKSQAPEKVSNCAPCQQQIGQLFSEKRTGTEIVHLNINKELGTKRESI